ncbi:hypothetical protein NFI96_028006, partial [Prochilodus magdalenae]
RVEAPVLTQLNNDTCNITLTCRGHDLSINSTCYKKTCEKREVTSPGGVTLSLSVRGSSIICNQSNPASWKEDVLEMGELQPLCADEYKGVYNLLLLDPFLTDSLTSRLQATGAATPPIALETPTTVYSTVQRTLQTTSNGQLSETAPDAENEQQPTSEPNSANTYDTVPNQDTEPITGYRTHHRIQNPSQDTEPITGYRTHPRTQNPSLETEPITGHRTHHRIQNPSQDTGLIPGHRTHHWKQNPSLDTEPITGYRTHPRTQNPSLETEPITGHRTHHRIQDSSQDTEPITGHKTHHWKQNPSLETEPITGHRTHHRIQDSSQDTEPITGHKTHHWKQNPSLDTEPITGHRGSSDVVRSVGDSVQLDTQRPVPEFDDLSWMFNKATNVIKYNNESKKPKHYPGYKDRVEFNEGTYSLTLKYLQKTDSGLYEAKTSNHNVTVVAEYSLSVLAFSERIQFPDSPDPLENVAQFTPQFYTHCPYRTLYIFTSSFLQTTGPKAVETVYSVVQNVPQPISNGESSQTRPDPENKQESTSVEHSISSTYATVTDQVVECGVDCQGDRIISRSVRAVGELALVRGAGKAPLYMRQGGGQLVGTSFQSRPGIPSEPVAFRVETLTSALLTSSAASMSGVSMSGVSSSGEQGNVGGLGLGSSSETPATSLSPVEVMTSPSAPADITRPVRRMKWHHLEASPFPCLVSWKEDVLEMGELKPLCADGEEPIPPGWLWSVEGIIILVISIIYFKICKKKSADPVDAPVLTHQLSNDTCNITLTCRGQDLSINSSCYNGTCEEKNETSPGGVTLSLSVRGSSIICNHSNPVSWKNKTLEMGELKRSCTDGGEHSAQDSTGVVVSIVVPVAVVTIISIFISVYVYQRRSSGVSEEQLYSSVPGVS